MFDDFGADDQVPATDGHEIRQVIIHGTQFEAGTSMLLPGKGDAVLRNVNAGQFMALCSQPGRQGSIATAGIQHVQMPCLRQKATYCR